MSQAALHSHTIRPHRSLTRRLRECNRMHILYKKNESSAFSQILYVQDLEVRANEQTSITVNTRHRTGCLARALAQRAK